MLKVFLTFIVNNLHPVRSEADQTDSEEDGEELEHPGVRPVEQKLRSVTTGALTHTRQVISDILIGQTVSVASFK